MSFYILWQNKDLPSPRVPWEPTDRGLESGQWDDSRSSRNTWPLKTVRTADFPEPKTFRNFSDPKGIAWFWRVGENCESFLVFRSLWVMVSLHVVLWCTSDFWAEFAYSNLPCFGAIYICRKTRWWSQQRAIKPKKMARLPRKSNNKPKLRWVKCISTFKCMSFFPRFEKYSFRHHEQ